MRAGSPPVRDPHNPQVIASGSIIETEHPVAGPVRQARPAACFSCHARSARLRGAPRLGEHNVEILAEIGIDSAEMGRLVAAGGRGAEHGEPAPSLADTDTVLTRGA